MKKLHLALLVFVMAFSLSCQKEENNTTTQQTQNTARTVDGITFTGQTVWLKFGTREDPGTGWECMSSYDYCEYQYIADANTHTVTAGEATGEIGYDDDGVLMIALDVSSLTTNDHNNCYSRNGEFHWGVGDGLRTQGFTMKNVDDPDQTTAGDITVLAGDYPVYEDANSILIVFEEP